MAQNLTQEKEVLDDIMRNLSKWKRMAKFLQGATIFFGIISISSSIFIIACAGLFGERDLILIKIVASISAISLTVLGAFNLQRKTTNAWNAWRFLNSNIYRYKTGQIDINNLILCYEEGEKIMGSVEFTYDKTNFIS